MGNIDSNIPEDTEPFSPGYTEPTPPGYPEPTAPGYNEPSPPGDSEASPPRRVVGSREKPVRFQRQHFGRLRSQLLRERQLFKDPNFPAGAEALGRLKTTGIEWIRASDLFKNPQFFVESISTTDICQGELGDCWFLAAMSSLTLNESLFAYVVPSNQSFQKNYAGIFRFRVWIWD
ncbi:calpain-2 catalytic subunit-like [Mustelus asterias]